MIEEVPSVKVAQAPSSEGPEASVKTASWVDIVSDGAVNKAAWDSFARRLDEGSMNWGLTPQEFVALSNAEQTEHGKDLQSMVANITHALRIADEEVPVAEQALGKLNYVVIDAADAANQEHKAKEKKQRNQRTMYTGEPQVIEYKSEEARLRDAHTTGAISPEHVGVSAWIDFMPDKELVRHDVLVFDISDALDPENRPASITMSALPVLNGDIEKTKELASATHNALRRINELSKHPVVQEAMQAYANNPVKIVRYRDPASSVMDEEAVIKSTPVRMYSEAMLTTAQTMALVMADYKEPVSVAQVGAAMAHAHMFEKIARGLPSGIVGPFAMRGLMPKDGLLKRNAKGLELDPEVRAALKQATRLDRDEARLVFGAVAVAKAHPEILEREAVEAENFDDKTSRLLPGLGYLYHVMRSSPHITRHSYSRGRGCPAVFVDKEAGSPIELAATMVLRPYMPKRQV